MRRKRKVLWLWLSCLVFPIFGESPSLSYTDPPLCGLKNTTFLAGEKLTYTVYYKWSAMWVPAAEVVFQVSQVGKEYKLSAIGKTYNSYNWFFEVEDHYTSFVNSSTMLPSTSIRDVREGKYTVYDKLFIDQKRGKVTSYRGKKQAEAIQAAHFETKQCVHDMLSAIYYCRNIDFSALEPNQTFPIDIFMDKEEWPLSVRYVGLEKNKTIKGLGRFNTIKFTPDVVEGTIFKKGAVMNVWVTDDANRLPLLIESPLSVGSMQVVLTKHEGLRYPIVSKLK